MSHPQPGILPPPPRVARHATLRIKHGCDPRTVVGTLADAPQDGGVVVGVGSSLALALGAEVDGLRTFPPHVGPGFEVPSTPEALWLWFRGEDRGEVLHASLDTFRDLAPAFEPTAVLDSFQYGASRDLTGYEDGTENPVGDAARAAALAEDGSSFVAVQQWVHDLGHFRSFSQRERDHMLGRRLSDNEELDDAPESAHVKRTAQESFEPEAFVLRRSMPWADARREGLVFVAFGHAFDAYEALLRRMVGAEDGVTDALFRFTRPVTGAYFWCPPMVGGKLALG
jgi:putative iron-dependent peroxidase